MQSLNKYKITFNNQEIKNIDAHDFDIVGNCVVFIRLKIVSAGFSVSVIREKIFAIGGGDIYSIELIESGAK